MDSRVEKVKQSMRDNLAEKRSLRDYADSVDISVWHLCRLFKSETRISPIQYLTSLRMEKASHLLRTSSLGVKEVSHSVGIRDVSHFVRDFKKTYGATPTLYRTQFSAPRVKESESPAIPAKPVVKKENRQ